MFNAQGVKVLISAPGGTDSQVETVKLAIADWNGERGENAGALLLPRFWRSDAVPVVGKGSGQDVINRQLVDGADIVMALFDTRLGMATDVAVSGTAEEIQRASAQPDKHVHVFFSNGPIDRSQLKEAARLEKFRQQLFKEGLIGDYGDNDDLRRKIRTAIEHDVTKLLATSPLATTPTSPEPPLPKQHAIPVVTVVNRGRHDYRLIVTNRSPEVTAEGMNIDFGELGNTAYREDDDAFDLVPYGERGWPLGLDMGSPRKATITLAWFEGDEQRKSAQTIDTFGN
ncbi:hypothetical protein [Williamsia sp.]|uniref:hypothetical protein n=1 Tax=Williamsia sp. TaxID=1872085 RepID=UPI002F934475